MWLRVPRVLQAHHQGLGFKLLNKVSHGASLFVKGNKGSPRPLYDKRGGGGNLRKQKPAFLNAEAGFPGCLVGGQGKGQQVRRGMNVLFGQETG